MRTKLSSEPGGRAPAPEPLRLVQRFVLAVRFTPTSPELDLQGSGLDHALGRLLSVVFPAQLDGTWTRLKACRREVCQWAFYDHSKNRLGTWCTMDICGNRV